MRQSIAPELGERRAKPCCEPHQQLRIMHTAAYGSGPARLGKLGKFPRRTRITAEQFRDARRFSGLTREGAAELVGVSVRTVGHWETGRARPNFAAFKLLRVYRHGDLIDPAWAGYSIVRGRLVTPENHTFEPHELSWLSLLVRRARAFSDLLRERDTRAAFGAKATEPARVARHLPAAHAARLRHDCDSSKAVDGTQGRSLLSSGRVFCFSATLIGQTNRTIEYSPMPQGANYRNRFIGSMSPCSNTGQNALTPEHYAHESGASRSICGVAL